MAPEVMTMGRHIDPTERPRQYIGAEGTEPLGEPSRTGEARLRDIQEQLDAALACTFPASDPISGCSAGGDCDEPG
jgi:hypothetical protein